MDYMNKDFFINQTTDFKSVPVMMHVTEIALFVHGIFDGATVRLEVSPDEYNPHLEGFDPDTQMEWFDHPNGLYTDAGVTEVHFWNNADLSHVWVRMVLENASDNTILSARARARLAVSH